MKRNAFKGIIAKPATCNLCGAEWEMGTRRPGETCGVAHGHKPPFTICQGILVSTSRNYLKP